MKPISAALLATLALATGLGPLTSCTNDDSPVGGVLGRGEVVISVDSLDLDLQATSRHHGRFDSRAATNLLGRLSTPEYGELDCSYVCRLLPTPSLGFPSTIMAENLDSAKLVLSIPRGSLAGDSLAPQAVTAYRLTAQLPGDIDNDFNPAGFYDPARPFGSASYTLSKLGASQTSYLKDKSILVRLDLGRDFALQVLDQYRNHPETFAWPSSFAQWFPGLYLAHSFGNGAVANVAETRTEIFYHYETEEKKLVDGQYITQTVTKTDSVVNFRTTPAVLSANRVSFTPSESLHALARSGSVVTSPGGYVCDFHFPADRILEKYRQASNSLTVVSELTMTLPASKIESAVGIGVPPTLLMVPTSELESFFEEQKVPDGVTSFWATYDEKQGAYRFSSLRQFISDLASQPSIDPARLDYTLVPILLGQENIVNAYGQVTGTQITSCTPYMAAPTMALLDTKKVNFVFTFSRQTLD